MNDHDVAQFLSRRVHDAEPPFTLDADIAIARGNQMRTNQHRRRAVATAAGVIVACVGIIGVASLAGLPRGSEPRPSLPADAGDMSITPTTTKPGQEIELRFPADSQRGVAFTFSQWIGGQWKLDYYLKSDWGEPGRAPDWWTAEEGENRGWPQVAVTGPGPDRAIVPDTAPAGNYLLCTATNTNPEACALLTVTASSE